MFKRLSAKKIRELDTGDRFARTAIWVYVLSFIFFPIYAAVSGNKEDASLEGAGLFLVLFWLFGLKLAATMFIPAMICGALVFFGLYKVTTIFVGPWIGAIIASTVAAYLSVLVSYHLDFDFAPMGLNWDTALGSYSFSNGLGVFAASLSVPIAAITWLGVMHSE